MRAQAEVLSPLRADTQADTPKKDREKRIRALTRLSSPHLPCAAEALFFSEPKAKVPPLTGSAPESESGALFY
jgi:hypothetical protein